MKRFIPFVLLLVGCFRYEPTVATNVLEEALLSETARAAGAMGVRVHGEITDTISSAQRVAGRPDPTGWYQAGVAWYYRPRIEPTVSIDPAPGKETARNIAAHEVAHAKHRNHDCAHWCLCNKFAVPTYPSPGDCSCSR